MCKGDVIGIEGNTGYSFGSHCHLEIRNANNKVTSTVNTPQFTDIPNKVGKYSVEEDEPMTAAERKELDAVKAELAEIKKANKVYHWWKEIPKWAYDPLWAMYKAGYFSGAAADDLNLSQTKMECLVVLARALKKDGKLTY